MTAADLRMNEPVGQGLQDGGHQHAGDGLVEDGVTHPDNVHHRRGAEDGQHVGGHALPEVEQEALDLNEHNTERESGVMRPLPPKCPRREESSPRQS